MAESAERALCEDCGVPVDEVGDRFHGAVYCVANLKREVARLREAVDDVVRCTSDERYAAHERAEKAEQRAKALEAALREVTKQWCTACESGLREDLLCIHDHARAALTRAAPRPEGAPWRYDTTDKA